MERHRVSATILAIAVVLAFPTASPQDRELDVPYVTTPYIVVDHMLEIADVGPGDYVIDLGSGDGRIVMAAAMRGANGHGVDLDPERVAEATTNASKDGLGRRVMFMEQDVFDTDVSPATVVTMYLLPSINAKLSHKLLNSLEPGSRILSHNFDMGDWEPDDWQSIKVRDRNHIIYFWIVPAMVEGNWTSNIEGASLDMKIEQEFQELDIELRTGDEAFWKIDDIVLKGDRLAFTAITQNRRYIFNGRIEADKIQGMVQIYQGSDRRLEPWNAIRN